MQQSHSRLRLLSNFEFQAYVCVYGSRIMVHCVQQLGRISLTSERSTVNNVRMNQEFQERLNSLPSKYSVDLRIDIDTLLALRS